MHEASASALDDWGEGPSSPPSSPSPSPLLISNHKRSSIPNSASNKPISISIPMTQFEHFQRSIQDSDGPTMAATGNYVTTNDSMPHGNSKDTINKPTQDHNVMSASNSPNVSCHKNSITPIRPQLPTLVNTNVQELSDSRMEIDTDSESLTRKRTLYSSNLESQQNHTYKKKPVTNEHLNLKDSLTNTEKNKKTLYSSSDQPPYIVHVYSNNNNEDPQLGLTHPLLISRTLSKIVYSEIKEIKKIGRGKILAEMTSAKAANNLVQNPDLMKENLTAFIPTYRTIRTGIVKDIPQHFEESNLLEFFDSSFKVIEVKRLNRRMKIDGEIKYIPSRTVCLKFSRQILPKYVFLCRNRYEVYPYISKVKTCFSCCRIGYISNNCKSKPRCLFCGNDAHESPSVCPKKDDNPLCINCKGEHLANSRDCPLIIKHKMILSLAASENISLIEAKRKVLQSTTNPKDIIYDYNNFPLLNSTKSSYNSNNYNSSPQSPRTYPPNVPHYNRFSILDILSNSPKSLENSPPSFNSLFQNPSKNKKQAFSHTNDKLTRLNKSPQKSEKNNTNYNFSAHKNLLYAPNGRLSISPINGSGYNASKITASKPDTSNPTHNINNSQEMSSQHTEIYSDPGHSGEVVKNVDITMLNNVFASLTQNLECIYNMIRSSCLPPSSVSSSLLHSPPSDNGQE